MFGALCGQPTDRCCVGWGFSNHDLLMLERKTSQLCSGNLSNSQDLAPLPLQLPEELIHHVSMEYSELHRGILQVAASPFLHSEAKSHQKDLCLSGQVQWGYNLGLKTES